MPNQTSTAPCSRERLTDQVLLRVTPSVRRAIEERAGRLGMAEFIRQAIDARLEREDAAR